MKYIAIDIETTGLDESYCQILEVGAVLADTNDSVTPLDKLQAYRYRVEWDRIIGEPYAIAMNAKIISEIPKREGGGHWGDLDGITAWFHWLVEKHVGVGIKATLAGKNYGTFDSRFLRLVPGWKKMLVHHRVLDVGNLWWQPTDSMLPDTKECIRRAALDWDEKLLHSAVDDCKLVVELVRRSPVVKRDTYGGMTLEEIKGTLLK